MSAPVTLTVGLSPDAARAVRDAVASGEFPDPSALVDAVVRSWHAERDGLFGYTADELDRLADEGEASGAGREPDFEYIKRQARRRLLPSSPRR